MRPSRDALVGWTSIILCSVAFLIYVANTFLYLTPPNPVKAQLLPLIMTIEHPVFAQTWHLFAPNPLSINFVLAVRCRIGEAVTSWRDITQPLLARHHRNRNSPMGRVLRVQDNAIRTWLGWSGNDEWRELICRKDRRHPMCRGEDPNTQQMRERGRFLLGRVASAACDETVGRERATAVQVQLLIHRPPPFSKRRLSDQAGATRYATLPWMPYQRVGSRPGR